MVKYILSRLQGSACVILYDNCILLSFARIDVENSRCSFVTAVDAYPHVCLRVAL